MSIDENDLLSLLDSDELPFSDKTDKTESEKPKYNKYGNSTGEKKVDYWGDIEIKPIEVDPDTIEKKGKSFAVLHFTPTDSEMPEEIATKLQEVTKLLVNSGYKLRHNGDKNELSAALAKIAENEDNLEIYLPWKKKEDTTDVALGKPSGAAYHHAAHYHKGFKKISDPLRAVTARDVHIILGKNCLNPINFLVCYSPSGSEGMKEIDYKTTGGMSFPMSMCNLLSIPIFNLGKKGSLARLIEFIKS